ncbi:hypothetical protein RHGRI_020750 [Rhododendron griersonianum]|uniref:Secreted protein n=1 Tax=Rhododendron griersonianum TaxID=479676 RepID=A0AAV6JM25_9ERIC|nr:hypothetical protein RHGRI_020750 [Rhododendron griersonianum]
MAVIELIIVLIEAQWMVTVMVQQYIYLSYRVSGKIHHKECFPSDHLIYQMRAATTTALGGVAACAKLLADQEDRGIQCLVATIIER